MLAGFSCGDCGSEFNIDSDDVDYVFPLIHRFFDAHARCGFATPLANTRDVVAVTPVGRVLRERKTIDPIPVEADDE